MTPKPYSNCLGPFTEPQSFCSVSLACGGVSEQDEEGQEGQGRLQDRSGVTKWCSDYKVY